MFVPVAIQSRKHTAWKIVLFTLAAAVLIMFCFVGVDWWQERRSHFVRYPEFGIEIPTNYSIHGIDVSKYQGLIDWDQVHGSGTLVRWLLENDLVDEMTLLIVPVVLGQGTRLFPGTGPDLALDLAGSRADSKGVMIQVYRPAGRPRYAAG